MGTYYELCNFTRRERIRTDRINGMKAREMVWSHASAAVLVWYCLRRRGDQIAFVSDDTDMGREFFGHRVTEELVGSFTDVTEETIAHAVAAGVLIDNGTERVLADDPELLRRLIEVDRRPGGVPPEGL